MTQGMTITAIAPWFGGKRMMASRIVHQLGRHHQYFDPFCGSLSVLFSKPPSPQETVNDLHGDLVNLALVVQDLSTASDLYDRLVRTIFSDLIFDQAKALIQSSLPPDRPDVDRAWAYFVLSWMGRNGIAGTNIGTLRGASYAIAVRWTPGGGSPTTRFRSATESIPAWHDRLRNVVVLRRDAFDIIPRFDDTERTAIYCDPPYMQETRTGCSGGGSKSHYLHEFKSTAAGDGLFSPSDDHVRLRDLLSRFTGARVVVSYYDCPRVRELYRGWTFIDCRTMKNLGNQNARGGRSDAEAPEVLIVNGPEYPEAGQ